MDQPTLIYSEVKATPLTLDNWNDFVALFDQRGAQNGCWCMYWRVTRREFTQNFGENNRKALHEIVKNGVIPGILAYHQGRAFGWCSVAPRQDFASLERSRTLRQVDEKPVWSLVCFYIDPAYRNKGVSKLLIQAAIDYAQSKGAKIIEAYPLDMEIAKSQPYERYMGMRSNFEGMGFVEAVSRSARRSIMRYSI